MAVRITTLLTIFGLIALVAQSQADENTYLPDYPLIHDCIVSIQTARPEVTMTEKMFFAVMECEAFEAVLNEAESQPHVPDGDIIETSED